MKLRRSFERLIFIYLKEPFFELFISFKFKIYQFALMLFEKMDS